MKPRRLTRIAMLTAIALTIFLVEAQIPAPLPVPGVKPGLANIVTVYAMFFLGRWIHSVSCFAAFFLAVYSRGSL